MLKIDGAGTEVSSTQVVTNSSRKQQSRRQFAKKLGINPPQPLAQAAADA